MIRKDVAAVLCVFLPIAVTQIQPLSLKGKWVVDFSRSLNPYGNRVTSVMLDILEDDGNIFIAKEKKTFADGAVSRETINAPVDGEYYPVAGSPIDASVAISRWQPGAVTIKMRTRIGFDGQQTCRLSADSASITCDEIDANSKGKRTFARSFYRRQ